jgi:hypothetical protein
VETNAPIPGAFREILADVAAQDPRPKINVALSNGNRISLANWRLGEDCVIEAWPNGDARYLIPNAQIVVVEITEPSS